MALPTLTRSAPTEPPDEWPAALKTIHGLAMAAQQPMMVAGGPNLETFYNTAFEPILGSKHPAAAGQPYSIIWAEVWPELQPLISLVLSGEAVYFDNMAFALNGRDDRLMGWYSFSLTPVRNDSGVVAGFLVVVSDTTETVILQRRQSFGLELDQALRQHVEPRQVLKAAADLLGPFLQVDRCAYAEINEATGTLMIAADWADDRAASLTRTQPLTALSQSWLETLRAGQAVPVSSREPSRSFLLRAALLMPVVKASQLVAVLLVDIDTPRRWTDDDKQLVRDVAERTWAAAAQAQAEAEIQELNRTLELRVAERTAERDRLWRSAQELITVVGGNGLFLSVNPASRLMLGYAPEEMLGRSVFDFLHLDDQVASRERIPAYIAGETRTIENRYRHADGTYRTIAWSVVFDGTVFYARGRDVTSERTALLALQMSEARLQAMFETSYQLKWLLDFDGRIVSANETALEAIASDSAAGQFYWSSPWFGDTSGITEQVYGAVQRAQSGHNFQNEVELLLPGGLRQFDLSIRPIRDLDGTIIAIMPEALDITERRATEEALRQSQKMEAVGQLTGGLAHDFNNLLTGIGGALELIGTRLVQNRAAEVPLYLDAAQESVRRAGALTHRMLAFSRRQTLLPRRVDVNQLAAGMEDLIRRTVGPSITVAMLGAQRLPPVLADANQLENAILNLCINARDAMPDGGTLTIGTAIEPGAADLPAGPLVALRVSDTGSGMAAEVAARAFDPFFTTKPLGVGTGLGLSMVYGFVQQSGGGIRLSSTPGIGTDITLYFPAQAGAADAMVPAYTLQPASGRGETVLVVEDEDAIRSLISDVLCEYGYNVLLAGNAQAALLHLGTNASIDLLVTDIGLPGSMNGRQLAHAARQTRPALPILLITGFVASAVIDDGPLEHGMALLTKPFTMAALTVQIQELLARP